MSKLFEEAVDAHNRTFLLEDLGHPVTQDAHREDWLEKTQHMRVVALNEACSLAKATLDSGRFVGHDEVLHLAGLFADFLVDGKH